MRRIVVKFGGTSLADGSRIRKGAKSVYREYKKGNQVAVVVSAMGDTTDELIEVAGVSTGKEISPPELDDILSMGERTSARIFAAALRGFGADAWYFDPAYGGWPVITDSNFGSAEVDLKETKQRVLKHVLPLMRRGKIPVIPGFLGKDERDHVTTLGRGGSDITAFLLGKCLGADEVIVVTDVEGVMTADEDKVRGARLIERISVEELRDLGRFGARVMHPRAMDYKAPETDAKVIHFRHGNLNASGTTIVGGAPEDEPLIRLHEKPISMLTVVGEQMQTTPGVLVRAVAPLSRAGVNLFGVSIGPRSFSVYVEEGVAQRALEILHRTVKRDKLMKSVTGEENLAMIVAESEKFIYTPGMIAKLTQPFAKAKINIAEILSSKASISLFVNWDDRKRAFELLKKAMRGIG